MKLSSITQVFALISLCLGLHAVPTFAEIQSTPEANPSFDPCAEMAPGESRVITPETLPKGTAIPYPYPEYILNRDANSTNGKANYEAVVNIQFKPVAPDNNSIIAPMLDYVENCYANLQPIEDGAGRTLTLRIARANEYAPARSVNLTSAAMPREDMINWSTQSNCRTIVHETFHLLGLVDLYPETSLKTATGTRKFDCRNLGPSDSVMRSLTISHFSSEEYVEYTCGCNSISCAKDLAKMPSGSNACPASAHESSFPIALEAYDVATRQSDHDFFQKNYTPLLKGTFNGPYTYEVVVTERDNHPLLYPAEFRMLIHPGCTAQNNLYYQCSANAYLSSSVQSGCKNSPAVCQDANAWLQ